MPNTDSSNTQLIAALFASLLALISSIVAVWWNARTSRRVKIIELSYPFNKSRLESLVVFYNTVRKSNKPASDVVSRIKFSEGYTANQEELNNVISSTVQSCLAVRDLYEENRQVFGKRRRRQLDSMLRNIQDKQPYSRQDKDYEQKRYAFLLALTEFADALTVVTKQEIDSIAEKLSTD